MYYSKAIDLAVGKRLDGLLEVFYLPRLGPNLYHNFQEWTPNGLVWHGWRSRGWEQFHGQLFMISNADGRLEVFARTPPGTNIPLILGHAWQTVPNDSRSWSEWESMGQLQVITAGQNADGRLELFGYSLSDNKIRHNWQQPPGPWAGWHTLSNLEFSGLGCGRNGDGRLEIFATRQVSTGSYRMYHSWQLQPNGTTGWSRWETLGGDWEEFFSPSIATNADGRLQVFIVGKNDRLYSKWQLPTGGWSSQWLDLGGNWARPALARPSVEQNSDGRLELFMLGNDLHLYHKWQLQPNDNAGWSGWASLGDPVAADSVPQVILNNTGHLTVFQATGGEFATSRVRMISQTANGWSNWETV
jgi:hypothetical protein